MLINHGATAIHPKTNSRMFVSTVILSPANKVEVIESVGTCPTGSDTNDEDSTGSYDDEIPECGVLINVKPKLGERVSRVHPDHTSHLLRSRFRKKYLRKAPFDKYMN